MVEVAEVVAGFGRGRGEWEATRGVRRVSGMRPEVAKVVVAGCEGSEGGESRRTTEEEMTRWQGVSELGS